MAIRRVTIIGAGIVGLSTAWFLQERDIHVTVVDRDGIAADASWGNAGWVAPALTLPLPEPAVLRYGLRSMFAPASPVYVPPTADPGLLRFLFDFARHCTTSRWSASMQVFARLNRLAGGAYDELTAGGVDEPLRAAEPFLAAFTSDSARQPLLDEFARARDAGAEIEFDLLDGDGARTLVPLLGEKIRAGIRLHRQRFIDPPKFTAALAAAVRARGGDIVADLEVSTVRERADRVEVIDAGESLSGDAVVIATGAWLGELARTFGVRTRVQAGRGYSFSVTPDPLPTAPVYFPAERVACTPLHDRFRIAGMMEFRSPDAPLDPRRIKAIVDATAPLMPSIDWDSRREEWVGSRPCTADGLPLVGRTRSPRVFVAGGHGMWGVALGPLTGRLLADAVTGAADPVLRYLDPLR